MTIPVGSIDTAVEKRDEDLRSYKFLDAEKFPSISFKSKKVLGTPESFKVTGDLTIKDVTKEVTLTGGYTGVSNDTFGKRRVALHAKIKISRFDFNVSFAEKSELGLDVGVDVGITLRIEGIKVK